MANSTAPRIELVPQDSYLSWISDANLALLAPVVVYWAASLFYHLIDTYELAEKYRVHTPQEVEVRNRCTRREVVIAVIKQHLVQTGLGLLIDHFSEPYMVGTEHYDVWKISKNLGVSEAVAYSLYWYFFPACRFMFGFFLMDTWQYILHRTMHMNKFLYKHLHSVHHRLYVPYAYGALYNSLIEGLLLDTLGAFLSGFLAGFAPRELILFYAFSTLKTVDDHCGYEFPWDPLQVIFPNRATYHDIHHQQFGIKTNFSQPFFIHWDVLLKTKYFKTEQYIEHNKQIREKKFQEKQLEKKRAAVQKRDISLKVEKALKQL